MQDQSSTQLRPKNKVEWTQELYFHYNTRDEAPPRDINVLFWYNLNNNKGFRLTPRGYDVVESAGYTLYKHKIDLKTYPVTNKLLVLMDRVLLSPWYWNNKNDIIIMDETLSVLLELSGGDLFRAVKSNS